MCNEQKRRVLAPVLRLIRVLFSEAQREGIFFFTNLKKCERSEEPACVLPQDTRLVIASEPNGKGH